VRFGRGTDRMPRLLSPSRIGRSGPDLNIALPESIKHFVQERVSEGGYSSVSEYVRDLIRADHKRMVEERIDTLLLEGLDSGQPIPVTADYWAEKKRRLTKRLSKAIQPK